MLQFSVDHFEPMHTCCVYIKAVDVIFLADAKIIFDKITACST